MLRRKVRKVKFRIFRSFVGHRCGARKAGIVRAVIDPMSRKRNRESLPPQPPATPKTPVNDVNINQTPSSTGISTRRSVQTNVNSNPTPPPKKVALAANSSSTPVAAPVVKETSSLSGRRSERKSIDKSASTETLSQLSTSSNTSRRNNKATPITTSVSDDGIIAAPVSIDANEHISGENSKDAEKKEAEKIPPITTATVPTPDPEVDEHPYTLGHSLTVRYRDQTERLARIIERNYHPDSHVWRYYVHYVDFNRRNDEWIDSSRIISPPSVANILDQQYQQRMNQQKKHSPQNRETTPKSPPLTTSVTLTTGSGAMSASLFSTIADLDHDEHEGFDEESLLEHERVTKVKNIQYVQLGKYIMECWYFSPFPKEYYPNGYIDILYFDEFTLRFFRTKEELIRYQQKIFTSSSSSSRHPPGNEIYRDDQISMFEVDGGIEKIYCQNLCYLAKLFLDHKTLYWDVDPFLFYILCTRDALGFHPVGYFSKEKYSESGYNLACILSFPFVQRKGYGRFLMEFSYELSKKEEKVGSPEKPLSDLGALGYRSYWASTIVRLLRQYSGQTISIMDITCATSILQEDVITTLELLGLLKTVMVTKPPAVKAVEATGEEQAGKEGNMLETTETMVIYAPDELLEELMVKYPENKLKVDPDKLHWTPFYTMDPKKDKWSIVSMRAAAAASNAVATVTAASNTIAASSVLTNVVNSEPMEVA